MSKNKICITALFFCFLFLVTLPALGRENNSKDWSFSFYRGRWSRTIFTDIVLRQKTDFRDSYFTAAAVSRTISELGRFMQARAEINFGRHCGLQDHLEVNALAVLVWKKLPWERYLNSSIAYGSGISYAFESPAIEIRRHNPRPARLLKYMMLEFEVFLPPVERLSLFMRIHHRSGVFGIVRDNQGSNIIALGVRKFY